MVSVKSKIWQIDVRSECAVTICNIPIEYLTDEEWKYKEFVSI